MGCNVDWSATGAMLQGIGTIIGAGAVIIAALVGGTTFRAWRRQQLVQKHMTLAEQIMTLVFNAKEAIEGVRSPMKLQYELEEARKTLESSEPAFTTLPEKRRSRMISAQVSWDRINSYNDIWKGLRDARAPAYAFFGKDITDQIDRILTLVRNIRIDAEAYAEDDGADVEFQRKLRRSLTSSRSKGAADEITVELSSASDNIEAKLKPLLQEVASEAQKAIAETIKSTAKFLPLPFGFTVGWK